MCTFGGKISKAAMHHFNCSKMDYFAIYFFKMIGTIIMGISIVIQILIYQEFETKNNN